MTLDASDTLTGSVAGVKQFSANADRDGGNWVGTGGNVIDEFRLSSFTGPETLTLLTGDTVDINIVPATHTWAVDSNGNWDTNSSWSPVEVPDAKSQVMSFGSVITANRVVTNNVARTVNGVVFDNNSSCTITGKRIPSLRQSPDTNSLLMWKTRRTAGENYSLQILKNLS